MGNSPNFVMLYPLKAITKTREALRNLPYPGYHLTKFTRELFWGSTLTALYSLQLTFFNKHFALGWLYF